MNVLSDNSFFFGFFQETKQAAVSDLLRTAILYKEGGTYFDADVISLQPSSHLPPQFFVCEHPYFDEVEDGKEEEVKSDGQKEDERKSRETVLRHCGINPAVMRSQPPSGVQGVSSASSTFLHDVLTYQSQLLDSLTVEDLFKSRWGAAGPRAYHTVLVREWYNDSSASSSSSDTAGENENKRGEDKKRRMNPLLTSKRTLLRFAITAPSPRRQVSSSARREANEESRRGTGMDRRKREKKPEGEEDLKDSSTRARPPVEDGEGEKPSERLLLWLYGPSSFAPLQLTPHENYPGIRDSDFWQGDKLKSGSVKFNEAIKEKNVIAWHTYQKATRRLEREYLGKRAGEGRHAESTKDDGEDVYDAKESFMSMMRDTYCSVYCGSEILSLFSREADVRPLLSLLPESVLDRVLGLALWLQRMNIPVLSSWLKR